MTHKPYSGHIKQSHSSEYLIVNSSNKSADEQLSRDMTKPTTWMCAQHPPSLIRVFAVRMKEAWVLSYPLSATAKTQITYEGQPINDANSSAIISSLSDISYNCLLITHARSFTALNPITVVVKSRPLTGCLATREYKVNERGRALKIIF